MRQPLIRSALGLTLIFALTLATGALGSAEPATDFAARLVAVPPCAPLIAAARTNQIPLDNIDRPGPGSSLDPGDTSTALVTFREKRGKHTQWLVHLQAVAPDANEKSANPHPPMTIYSSCGSKMEFTSSPAFVKIGRAHV